MSNPGDVPPLEPLEESAAPAAPVAAAPNSQQLLKVAQNGMPAPAFSLRAQREYYRFFFAGLIMFLGCMMPFGPEWQMAGYQTMGGALFTLIALGIMWSSWVAISHGRFDLSSMRWLLFSVIPLTVMSYHLYGAFEEPAVVSVYLANVPALEESFKITDWPKFFDNLIHFKSPVCSAHVDNFLRAFGTGKVVLWFGSLFALLFFIKGVGSGIKAGKAQKKAQAAARASKSKSKKR